MKIRRALISVSDKTGIVELAQSLKRAGAEIVATGKTGTLLQEAGLIVTPIEKLTGMPEAFQGRMKTLSFEVCSGILARRGDASDEQDLKKLGIKPIDCVVVNFYPFEKAAQKEGITRKQLIEEVDIGGPTLVRAAAKNSPDVLVLTSPMQYAAVMHELNESDEVSEATADHCAATAWERVLSYDAAIARQLGSRGRRPLRYGENPHQQGFLEFDAHGPLVWNESLTQTELSYNNILDVSQAYVLASDLTRLAPSSTGVVIVKHNNPCGVATVPRSVENAQKWALIKAWEGDPVSAFGGVLVFTDPLEPETAEWLSSRFVELIAAPELSLNGPGFIALTSARKNLKAVRIRRFGEFPHETMVVVPGGRLFQTSDINLGEEIRSVTKVPFVSHKLGLAQFGISVTRSLKSNAIAIVRSLQEWGEGAYQLVGAGQGQPNRVEALEKLAIPRAREVIAREAGKDLRDCVMVSDAFFPFRDTVDVANQCGIKFIVQPGGSIKDRESIEACDEHQIAMAFTGVRHFKH